MTGCVLVVLHCAALQGFENILIRVKVDMNSSSNELTRTFTAAGHEERAWDFDGLYLVPLYKKARGFFRRDERLQFFRVNTRDGSKSSDEMSVRMPRHARTHAPTRVLPACFAAAEPQP